MTSIDPPAEQSRKDAEIRKIVERREREMAETLARGQRGRREERERKGKEEKAFMGQVAEEKKRAEQKEGWRDGQHEKRRELERERLRTLELRRTEERKREAAAQKRGKQKEYMDSLHRTSMFKKATAMRKSALLDEEKAKRLAKDHCDAAMRNMQERYRRDRKAIETEVASLVRRLDQQPLPPEQKKKRLRDIDATKASELQTLDRAIAARKAEIERLHTQEIARAENIKVSVFLLANRVAKS